MKKYEPITDNEKERSNNVSLDLLFQSNWVKGLYIAYLFLIFLSVIRPLFGFTGRPMIEYIPHLIVNFVLVGYFVINKYQLREKYPNTTIIIVTFGSFIGFFLGLIYVDHRFHIFKNTTLITIITDFLNELF